MRDLPGVLGTETPAVPLWLIRKPYILEHARMYIKQEAFRIDLWQFFKTAREQHE